MKSCKKKMSNHPSKKQIKNVKSLMIYQKTMAYKNERFKLNNLAKIDNMPDPNRFSVKMSVNPSFSVKKDSIKR